MLQEMISDDDGSMETSSLPNSVSDIEENEGFVCTSVQLAFECFTLGIPFSLLALCNYRCY